MTLLRITLLAGLLTFLEVACCLASEDSDQSQRSQRIVSLSPAATAMLCELDNEKCLVGVTRYCELPGELRPEPQIVGGAMDPNVESIMALQPDVIITSSLLPDNIESRFLSLGLKVKKFRQDKLEDILEQVLWLGEYTGSSPKALDEVATAKEIIEQARARSATGETAILIFSDKIELVAGGDTYASEVMALAGLSNVAAMINQPWPTISHEWLLAQNPDWILIATHLPKNEAPAYREKCLMQWRDHPVLSQLAAVQHGRIVTLPDNQLGIPSLRLFTAIEALWQQVTDSVEGGRP